MMQIVWGGLNAKGLSWDKVLEEIFGKSGMRYCLEQTHVR